MSFSAPSLSLSLKEQQLWVEVIFQCAPNAVCQTLMEGYDEDTPICCALGLFLTLNATVTLYNKHDMNDIQVIKLFHALDFSLKAIFHTEILKKY